MCWIHAKLAFPAGGTPYRHRLSSRRRSPPQSEIDRKSTRLNSSHSQISYAVFCLKKKKLACDRGGDLRFGLAPRNQAPETCRQPKLGLPRDVTHDLWQRFLSVRMLTPNAGSPLIR